MPLVIDQAELDFAILLGQELLKLLSGESTVAQTQQRIQDGIAQAKGFLATKGETLTGDPGDEQPS